MCNTVASLNKGKRIIILYGGWENGPSVRHVITVGHTYNTYITLDRTIKSCLDHFDDDNDRERDLL